MENRTPFNDTIEKALFLDKMRPMVRELAKVRNEANSYLTELKQNTKSVMRKNILTNMDNKLNDLINELVNDCVAYAKYTHMPTKNTQTTNDRMRSPIGTPVNKIGYR